MVKLLLFNAFRAVSGGLLFALSAAGLAILNTPTDDVTAIGIKAVYLAVLLPAWWAWLAWFRRIHP